jgi:hypothetical protein
MENMRRKKLLIIDTSVFCVWLDIPERNTCYDEFGKLLTSKEIQNKINDYTKQGYLFILPMAVIIETGNHIAQIQRQDLRKEKAKQFAEHITQSLDAATPWIAFDNQKALFETEKLREMVITWESEVHKTQQGQKGISIGDMAIAQVAQFYQGAGEVMIFTGDLGLRNFEYKSIKVETAKELPSPILRRKRK